MTLSLDGRLEDLALRWGVPNCPEFELGLYGRLFAFELRERLARLSNAKTAEQLAERGRIKRLLGDPSCVNDYRASLDTDPKYGRAQTWLAESALGSPQALAALDRAVELSPKDVWALCYRGAGRLLAGDAAGAAADLERSARAKEALPALLLGAALARLGKKEQADRAYSRALALEPSCSAAALLRARLWTGTRAEKAAEAALDAEPDHAHVALFTWSPEEPWARWLSRHGRFCFSDGRDVPLCARFGLEETRFSPYPSEAVQLSERALRLRGRRAWTLAVRGRALCRIPRADAATRIRARKFLDAAVAANPRAGWTWAWRALARLGDDPRGALSDLDRALALSPHYFRAYGWRGALLRRLGRLPQSLRDLDRAVAGDERYPFSLHERSLTRRAAGDLVGAALDLDRAYALDERYCWVYTAGREPSNSELEAGLAALSADSSCVSLRAWRGDALRRAGRLEEAAACLTRAADDDPAHALAAGFLGQTLLEAGRPREAAAVLGRAVKLDGRLLAFRAAHVEALRRCGRAVQAERALDAVLRERPRAWKLRLQRASWRLEQGRAAEALDDARRAQGLEGRDADGWFLEARALAALGRWKGAQTAVEKTLAIAPNLGRAYLLRAEIKRALGRSGEAVADFGVVLERFPNLFNEEERARVGALLAR